MYMYWFRYTGTYSVHLLTLVRFFFFFSLFVDEKLRQFVQGYVAPPGVLVVVALVRARVG